MNKPKKGTLLHTFNEELENESNPLGMSKETNIMKIRVSQQQYDKGQRYLSGLESDTDMYVLAQTYLNEIISLVGRDRVKTGTTKTDTDKSIFTEFCKSMKVFP